MQAPDLLGTFHVSYPQDRPPSSPTFTVFACIYSRSFGLETFLGQASLHCLLSDPISSLASLLMRLSSFFVFAFVDGFDEVEVGFNPLQAVHFSRTFLIIMISFYLKAIFIIIVLILCTQGGYIFPDYITKAQEKEAFVC